MIKLAGSFSELPCTTAIKLATLSGSTDPVTFQLPVNGSYPSSLASSILVKSISFFSKWSKLILPRSSESIFPGFELSESSESLVSAAGESGSTSVTLKVYNSFFPASSEVNTIFPEVTSIGTAYWPLTTCTNLPLM